MKKIEAKPYKLIGKIQHYDWGTKNDEAFIPKLLGIEAQKDLPYAEYWIGVHPKASSDVVIDNENVNLIELLSLFPKEILGEKTAKKFSNTLPFLLKVLSINTALSIQAHPDKQLAKRLYAKDSKNYPDENHKPEIAIAIDNLKAIVGLKKFEGIRNILNENPELKNLLSAEIIMEFANIGNSESDNLLKQFFTQIMNSSQEKLEKCITDLKQKFESKPTLNESEKQFLIQFENYGIDIGLISLLLFNMKNLKPGEAIFTPAGIPHAYIKGNIIECMANSDNVVRAGLTPKFKDINTLTEMLVVDSSKSGVEIIENADSVLYKTAAEEFEVEKLKLEHEIFTKKNDEVKVLIVIHGKIIIQYNNTETQYSQGDSVLIPAILKEYKISGDKSSVVYCVRIPD